MRKDDVVNAMIAAGSSAKEANLLVNTIWKIAGVEALSHFASMDINSIPPHDENTNEEYRKGLLEAQQTARALAEVWKEKHA